MASIIKIKRSETSGNPSTLAAGELAYSALADNGSNGGDRLYVGTGTETNGNAVNHVVIGGKFFTDMLDHTKGTLTANSAIIVDADKKIDDLLVDNLQLNGNTISTTDNNGNLTLDPNGTGHIYLDAPSVRVGNSNANATITSNGANNLILNTNSGTDSGSITINDGVDGNIDLTPNGTGSVVISRVDINAGTIDGVTIGTNSAVTDLRVDNLKLDGNTISTTDSNGNLVLDPNGTGKISFYSAYTFPDTDGSAGYVLTTNGSGVISWAASSSTLTVKADAVTTEGINLLTETLEILGGEGIDTTVGTNSITISGEDATTSNKGIASFNSGGFDVTSGAVSLKGSVVQSVTTDSGAMTPSGNAFSILGGEGMDVTHSSTTITIAGEDATSSNKGIASFNTASFTVTNGDVTIKTGGVSNSQLANSSVTFGSTTVSLGGTSTSLAGLTELTVDNININGNEISSTNSNGNISLNPNGTGSVDVNGAKITNVGTPQAGTDAANKNYVDNAVSGLAWKESVHLLADTNIALTGTTGTLVIDSHSALDQTDSGIYRILLIAQTSPAQDGIYLYTDDGSNYTLTRATDADTAEELIGAAVFVMEGTVYANTSWVQSNHYLTDLIGGNSQFQDWVQFSGAGAYTAGDGLGQTGTTFFVKVSATGGIEISSDSLQLKSTVAGNGLTLTSGVLAVGGTADRITVGSDAIDIASTYVGQSSITTVGTLTTGALGTGFTTVAVPQGGTGATSFTTNGILYGNSTSAIQVTAAGTWDAGNGVGQLLSVNASGVPTWTNTVDGGTY